MTVEQDGAYFFRVDTYELVWTAPFRVYDDDMKAAQKAREAFISWAKSQNLTIHLL